MAYKAELQSNNTDLQSILDSLNTMPDALDTSDATAVSSDISTGKTAYVNGEKITGNGEMARDLASEISSQDDLIAQIVTALDGKAGVVLPTLSNPASAENIENGYEAIDGNGYTITGTAVLPTIIPGVTVSYLYNTTKSDCTSLRCGLGDITSSIPLQDNDILISTSITANHGVICYVKDNMISVCNNSGSQINIRNNPLTATLFRGVIK